MNPSLLARSPRRLFVMHALISLGCIASPAAAQVFGPGPSSASLFDTVINLPDDGPIDPQVQSNGAYVQLNVLDGTSLDLQVGASSFGSSGPGEEGVEVNVDGGAVAGLSVFGGELNILGGNVGHLLALADVVVSIEGGTVGDNSTIIDGTAFISGGTFGDSFNIEQSVAHISGGVFGREFFSGTASTIHISGGTFGDDFIANNPSTTYLSGGTIGDNLRTTSGALIEMTGGAIGDGLVGEFLSVTRISGGDIGDNWRFEADSELHLIGTEFLIDGTPLSGLALGETLSVTRRDGLLTGRLNDGSAFDFDLELQFENDPSSPVILTVTLTPEPSAALLVLISVGSLRWHGRTR